MGSKKIGLLVCDKIKEPLVKDHGEYLDMYQHLLPDFSFKAYHVFEGEFPADVKDHEVYLCSGSSFSVYQDIPWIHELSRFIVKIKENDLKLVGICFGHQMIAHALGGNVQKAAVGWCIGVHQFHHRLQTKWMDPPKESVNLLMLCQDQVVEIPEGGEILYQAEDCPVGIMTVGENMLGIQAHPEFSKIYKMAILEMRKELLGEEKIFSAHGSMRMEVDKDVVGKWISNFIVDFMR